MRVDPVSAESCYALDVDADGDGVLARDDVSLGPPVLAGRDRDGDGYPDLGIVVPAGCLDQLSMVPAAGHTDCDDRDPSVGPAWMVPTDRDADGAASVNEVAPSCEPFAEPTVWDCDDSRPDVGQHVTEQCDWIDHDCDGRAGLASCAEEWDCRDGLDNDGNGLVDELDPNCNVAISGERCHNGIDDDLNGLIDCEEAVCLEFCTERCGQRFAGDHRDYDGDGLVGCDDPDCRFNTECRHRDHWDDGVAVHMRGIERIVTSTTDTFFGGRVVSKKYYGLEGSARWWDGVGQPATYSCQFVIPYARVVRNSYTPLRRDPPVGCQGRISELRRHFTTYDNPYYAGQPHLINYEWLLLGWLRL